MASVIKAAIVFVLANYSLTFLVVGLLFAIISIARARKPIRPSGIVEKLLSWHVFWAIGVGYFYNFVMHGFFGRMSAAFIGWADSPFQFEVATASLGFAVVGFLAAFRSFDLRFAAIVGPGLFMLGAAAGHVYQMVTEHNFAQGNAGVIFYIGYHHPAVRISAVVAPASPWTSWRQSSTTPITSHRGGPRFLHDRHGVAIFDRGTVTDTACLRLARVGRRRLPCEALTGYPGHRSSPPISN